MPRATASWAQAELMTPVPPMKSTFIILNCLPDWRRHHRKAKSGALPIKKWAAPNMKGAPPGAEQLLPAGSGVVNHANNIFWNTKASAAIKDLSLHLLSMGQHFLSFLICSMPAGGASI
jgi:hypothetical protein